MVEAIVGWGFRVGSGILCLVADMLESVLVERDSLRRIELQGTSTFTLPTSPMAILHGFSIQGSFLYTVFCENLTLCTDLRYQVLWC